MEKVRVDEVDNGVQPAAVMRHLTEPLGATDLAINYYEFNPATASRSPSTTTRYRRNCSTFSREQRRSRPRPVR